MRSRLLSRWIRGVCLGLMAGGMALRPLISGELNPRVAAVADGLLIGCAWLVVWLAGPRRLAPLRGLRLPLGLWLAALVIGVALHGADSASLEDRLALAGGPVLLCAAATSWGSWRRRVLEGVFLIAAAIGALAIWQSLVILPDLAARSAAAPETSLLASVQGAASRGRTLGTFALPTLLAGYLSLVVPLALDAVIRSGAKRMVVRAGLLGTLLVVAGAWIFTHSIGAWVSLAAACAVVWLKRPGSHRWPVAGAIVVVLCGTLMVSTRPTLWSSSDTHHPIRNRLVYWESARRLIARHPLLGVGPGQFLRANPAVSTTPAVRSRYAHNSYLQIWAEYGLVGLVAWGWLLVGLLRKTASLSPWLAVAVWVLPLHNVIDFSFYVPQVSMLWWYLAGWTLRQASRPFNVLVSDA